MNQSLLGVLSLENNAISLLSNGLQKIEKTYGKWDRLGVATFSEGCTKCIENKGSLDILSAFATPAHLAIAFLDRPQENGLCAIPAPELYSNNSLALVYIGQIVNAKKSRLSLLQLGFQFETQHDSEVVLRLINRYFEVGMSLSEAASASLKHLKGEFAILALDARHQELLIIAHGYPLSLGVEQDTLYIASNTPILTTLSYPLLHLKEAEMFVLHSI